MSVLEAMLAEDALSFAMQYFGVPFKVLLSYSSYGTPRIKLQASTYGDQFLRRAVVAE